MNTIRLYSDALNLGSYSSLKGYSHLRHSWHIHRICHECLKDVGPTSGTLCAQSWWISLRGAVCNKQYQLTHNKTLSHTLVICLYPLCQGSGTHSPMFYQAQLQDTQYTVSSTTSGRKALSTIPVSLSWMTMMVLMWHVSPLSQLSLMSQMKHKCY